MPGQTSVAPGPAARGFALPFLPDLLTCFLNFGVNQSGGPVLRVDAAVAELAPTGSASTAAPAANAVRFMDDGYPGWWHRTHCWVQWHRELPHMGAGDPRSRRKALPADP